MANEEKMAESDGYICPPCRIYYPTPQEFINPLTYIASIRAEASQTGICKIVPPQGWRPPFAVNEKKFRFRTRLQPLNSIEGNSRQEGKFLESLRMFLYRKGTPMHELPTLNGKVANLSLLYKIVVDQGGYEAVTQQSSWSSVVHNLHELTDLLEVPCSTIEEDTRSLYSTWLLPYEIHQKGLEKSTSKIQNQGDVVNSPEHPSGTALPVKRGRGRPKKVDLSDGSNVGSPTPCSPPDQRVESNESAQSTPIIFPGLIKRGRGRPRKGATSAIRILSSDVPEDVDPAELEPSALAADPERNSRLDPPMVRVGQKFYRSYQGGTTILGEVKKVIGGKKPTVSVEYAGGSKETISYGSMQLLLANGKDSASAELVLTNQICQYCLRGDCWEKMLLCDSCNGGYHIFCLCRPLAEVPQGDWYCELCMAEHEKESNTVSSEKFGFEMGAEYTLASFKAKADEWQQAYFQSSTIPTIQELEKEYWRVLLTPHQKIQVEYGSDIDTAAMGSGFPTIEKVRKVRNRLLDRYNSVHGNTNRDEDPNELGLRRLLAEGLNMDTESNFDYINQIDMYAHSPWNLTNLPKLNGSMLQYLDENIKGVMVPWISQFLQHFVLASWRSKDMAMRQLRWKKSCVK
ncbi:hypothetical protein Ae201684P_008176 [Aphanomyces euteiches]|nr:hypothetical protein Ae201684P_008176 [Aphanomyces euteiches]